MSKEISEIQTIVSDYEQIAETFKREYKPLHNLAPLVYNMAVKGNQAAERILTKAIEENAEAVVHNIGVKEFNEAFGDTKLITRLKSNLALISSYENKIAANQVKIEKLKAILDNPKQHREHLDSKRQLDMALKQIDYYKESIQTVSNSVKQEEQ